MRIFHRTVWCVVVLRYFYEYFTELFYRCIKVESRISDGITIGIYHIHHRGKPDRRTADRENKMPCRESKTVDSAFCAHGIRCICADVCGSIPGNGKICMDRSCL